MLSYQHSYHAGNFADLIKHMILVHLLSYLNLKEKPYFYLETHAGRGLYDLRQGQAAKNKEFDLGIAKIWDHPSWDAIPEMIKNYLAIIRQYNEHQAYQTLRYYPGSPAFALKLLRPQDRMYAYERHPEEFHHLVQLKKQGIRAWFDFNDGLQGLKAQLPPKERRGLVFIDPSFEIKTDYKTIPECLLEAYQKFSTGVYCLWYPMVDTYLHEQLLRGLDRIPCQNKLRVEWTLDRSLVPTGMASCGLWLMNPPYLLKETLQQSLVFLVEKIYQNKAKFQIL